MGSTLAVIVVSGDSRFFADSVYSQVVLPESLSEWLATRFILGQWTWLTSHLIPQAWALNIELIYYLAIPLFIGRRREYALACFVTSLMYTAWICKQQLPLDARYFMPISGMLPFSFGAVIYFYRDAWKPSALMATLLSLLAFAHVFVYGLFEVEDAFVENVPLYLNVLLFGVAIWALANIQPPASQVDALREAISRLAPGGILLYKDMVERPFWRAWANRCHDLVMARQWIHYLPLTTVLTTAKDEGLTVIHQRRINTLWYGHELAVLKAPG